MQNAIEYIVWAWNDINVLIFFGVGVAYFIYDVIYAHFMLSVTGLRAGWAATFSSLLYIIGAIGVLSYVENFIYTIPIVIGGWLGTYWAVKREKQKSFFAKKTPPPVGGRGL